MVICNIKTKGQAFFVLFFFFFSTAKLIYFGLNIYIFNYLYIILNKNFKRKKEKWTEMDSLKKEKEINHKK